MISLNSTTTLEERNQLILDAVTNNDYKINWTTVNSIANGNTASFTVFDDALKMDIEYTDKDEKITFYPDVRVDVSATLEQQIADLLNCSLFTSKIADLVWDQASCKVNPLPRTISSATDIMIQHSTDVDLAIARTGCGSGLTSTVGKHWILDNTTLSRPGKACNYGWHFTTGMVYKGIQGYPNATLLKNPANGSYWCTIQPPSWAHDAAHTDYSQICQLVARDCIVNGQPMDILEVFQSSTLAYLANNGGVLRALRVA